MISKFVEEYRSNTMLTMFYIELLSDETSYKDWEATIW
jgi:hypothetical protein